MSIPSSVQPFLAKVQEVSPTASAIRLGDAITPLYHCFWTPDEIAKGLAIKAEWDVPDDLIPFYGDWHDLLAISSLTGKILMVDDARYVTFEWEDGDAFLACLTQDPDDGVLPGKKALGIVGGWLAF
jgi:hypothetical protein